MQAFMHNKYYAKMKFFKLFGGEISIYDESGVQLLLFIKQKAFKLKEDITVYGDKEMSQEIMKIQARSVVDFSAAYDITMADTGAKVGALARKGFKSILRDNWEIFDAEDNVIGKVQEDSMVKATLRRFLSNLIPQSFDIVVNNRTVGVLKQSFNPFVPQFHVDFTYDVEGALDRRLGLGTVILLQIVEGRQE